MRRSWALAWSLLVATAVGWPSRQAYAAASARLIFVRGPGAAGCPGEAAVHAAVRARLGYDPFFAWARDTLFVEIQRKAGAFVVQVKLVDRDNLQRGEREIAVTGDDCSSVIDVMSLTISLTIDPASVIGAAAPPPTPPPEPGPPAADERRESPVDVSVAAPSAPPRATIVATRSSPRQWTLHAGVGGLASVNAEPSAAPGATLLVGMDWRSFSLDLEGRADFPASRDVSPGQVRTWLLAGSIVPCVRFGIVLGCATFSVGAIGATAGNVASAVERYGPWSAVGGRAGAEWAMPFAASLRLRLQAELLATLTRDALFIDDRRVYTVGPWSADAGGAVIWDFH